LLQTDEGATAAATKAAAQQQVLQRTGIHGAPPKRPPSATVVSSLRKATPATNGSRPDTGNGAVPPASEAELQALRAAMEQENREAQQRARSGSSSGSGAHSSTAVAESKSSSSDSGRAGAKGSKGVRSSSSSSGAKGTADYNAVAPAKGPAQFSMTDAHSLSRQLGRADARTQRARDLSAAVTLSEERFVLYSVPPVGPLEQYQARLRDTGAGGIKQIAVQTRDDDRSMETQTDTVTVAHKEVQFHLGHDDTALENMMAQLRQRRSRSGSSSGSSRRRSSGSSSESKSAPSEDPGVVYNGVHSQETEDARAAAATAASAAAGLSATASNSSAIDSGRAAARLSQFLRSAAAVMEVLCEENLAGAHGAAARAAAEAAAASEGARDRAAGRMFSAEARSSWEQLSARSSSSSSSSSSDAAALHELIGGCAVAAVAYSAGRPALLAAAYRRSTASRSQLAPGQDAVCVWSPATIATAAGGTSSSTTTSTATSSSLTAVLVGEGEIVSLCWGLAAAPHICLAGTAEGTVLLWDMRQQPPAAQRSRSGLSCGLRPPTYTTAYSSSSSSDGSGHTSAVVAVMPVPACSRGSDNSSSSSSSSSGGGGSGLFTTSSFLVASMDDRGTVIIWVATELPQGSDAAYNSAGSTHQSDLGLGPGGRVRFSHSRTLHVSAATAPYCTVRSSSQGAAGLTALLAAAATSTTTSSKSSSTSSIQQYEGLGPCATALAFCATDSNRFLVAGSSDGALLHSSRLGAPPPPRAYTAAAAAPAAAATVTCINFSPYCPEHFLAGCADGSVRLHRADSARPLAVWEGFAGGGDGASQRGHNSNSTASRKSKSSALLCGNVAICALQWSPHRAGVFYALDSSCLLHVFDLLVDDGGPLLTEPCSIDSSTVVGESKSGDASTYDASDSSSSCEQCAPCMALSSERLVVGSAPCIVAAAQGRVRRRPLSAWLWRSTTATSSGVSEAQQLEEKLSSLL
jgi:hypothetical protein